MRAFLNDAAVQSLYIGRVTQHAAADEIVQGKYWENGKGCAIGCTIHGSDHSKYETELGVPEELARLQDAIFEALPADEAKAFPLQFLTAIPIGADLSKVWDHFHVHLLLDQKDGLVAIPDMRDDCKGWIRTIAALFQCSASGTTPTRLQKDDAEKAAWDARAAWDAWAARDARDARAAWAAWAARAARDARAAWAAWAAWDAWAARDAWAAWAARDARIKRQRDVLLQLLREAPVQ